MEKLLTKIDELVLEEENKKSEYIRGLYTAKQLVVDRINELIEQEDCKDKINVCAICEEPVKDGEFTCDCHDNGGQ